MSGKIMITQEIADAITRYLTGGSKDDLIESHAKTRDWMGLFKPLNGIGHAELVRAVLLGYEIEPEYKVGDWVVRVDKEQCFNNGYLAAEIVRAYTHSVHLDGPIGTYSHDYIRHATPEEIKAEKERRVWKKLDREVGEFKNGDIGMGINNAPWVTLKGIKASYDKGRLKGFYPAESFISFEEGDSDD